jgi:hypothetical protein
MTSLPLWVQIVALGVPVLVSIFSAIWASRSARRAQAAEHEAARLRALEERTAEKKFELYQPMLQAFGNMLTPSRSKAALDGLEEVLADFQTFVTVWGSDEVVEAFFRYRSAASSSPPPPILFRLMSDFLIAARRDLAWPNTHMTGLHMLGMRINDLADQPDIVEAFSMPWPELEEKHGWKPPIRLPRTSPAN